MTIEDRAFAERALTTVSYYRLSAYSFPYRSSSSPNRFAVGTSFAKVWNNYRFDRRLRSVILDGIERVEIATRTSLRSHAGRNVSRGFSPSSLAYIAFQWHYRRASRIHSSGNRVLLPNVITGAWDATDALGIHNVFRYAFGKPTDDFALLGIAFNNDGKAVIVTPPLVNGSDFAISVVVSDNVDGTGNSATYSLNPSGKTVINETGKTSRFFRLRAVAR
ncbi:MAG: Abi family protein [Kiritimatiellae bacterium]|nr:Abi family protein [Kiritimatiellia bacterium]